MTTLTDNSQSSDWRDKITAFAPNFITHQVNGEDVRFYAISVGMMFRLKTIGRPLARSLAVLFGKNDRDQATADRQVGEDREIVIEAISEGLAKIRHEQKTEAIEGLIDGLTKDNNVEVIGEIIMNSMRDVFPPNDKSNPPAKEFMDSLPAPVLTALIVGVAKANKGVLGPLADQVADQMADSVARIAARNNEAPASQEESS
mgnify:CR=1